MGESAFVVYFMSLNMSFSFTVDIVREVFRYIPELEPLIDEIFPFRSDFQSPN